MTDDFSASEVISGFSDSERVFYKRLNEFYGDDLSLEFLREYIQNPKSSLAMASQRVLVRGEIEDDMAMTSFIKERFCSVPEEEIVFD